MFLNRQHKYQYVCLCWPSTTLLVLPGAQAFQVGQEGKVLSQDDLYMKVEVYDGVPYTLVPTLRNYMAYYTRGLVCLPILDILMLIAILIKEL